MIHPPDVIPKYAPYVTIGTLGGGGGGGAAVAAEEEEEEEEEEAGGGGGDGITMAEVGKHTTKESCWVVVSGQVLDVTKFLKDHPGGELAILTFAGKDATEEFNMIHPPDVIPKYAPYATIGDLGDGGSGGGGSDAPVAADVENAGAPAVVVDDKVKEDVGDMHANHAAWGTYEGAENWRHQGYDHNPGVFLFNIKAYFHAFWSLWLVILYEVCATIFSRIGQNVKISSDRTGLTRSAILLILFMVIHGVGNLHVFMGPDDFNGYGYFYVRLYWTGFGLPANIVEEYIILSAALHIFMGLIKTWDKKAMVAKQSCGQAMSTLSMGISGILLGTFMTIHLFQFRFGKTMEYFIRPPPCLISFFGIPKLELFWTRDETVPAIPVRDIYNLEYKIFNGTHYFWSFFYMFSVCVFMIHACWGWKKVTPKLGVPKGHYERVYKP